MKQTGSTNNKAIILGIVLGVCALVYIATHGLSLFKKQPVTQNPAKFKNLVLTIGNTKYKLGGYPDRIQIHGDYLLLIEPYKNKTIIFRRSTQKKIREENKIITDFDGTNTLTSENDLTTDFNNNSLRARCLAGFIKSPTEILCVVPKKDDNLDNKLVSIDPQTLQQTDIYTSDYTLNSVFSIDGKTYIGGYSLQGKNPVLITSGKGYPIQDKADVIYRIGKIIYFASYKSDFNHKTESYTEINTTDNGVTTITKERGEIIF